MRTPRLSEIDLTVADDVSVVAMVPVPGPHPTPCHAIHQREPGRAAACVFIVNNRVVRSRVRVAPSHTERAGVGPEGRARARARAELRHARAAISKDRPTERPGRGENSGTRRGEHADQKREP